MKTYIPKADVKEKSWYLVDARGKTIGRLAARIAAVLRGKHKPAFATHIDTGDFVIVINAEKVHYTGAKLTGKIYYHHSMYPNGLKSNPLRKLLAETPEKVIKKAVWGMLPKDRLGRDMFKKLKVYVGDRHPHQAQQPKAFAN